MSAAAAAATGCCFYLAPGCSCTRPRRTTPLRADALHPAPDIELNQVATCTDIPFI
jgi:hypothetical protein